MIERWLHDLGYTFFDMGELAMIEIDRMVLAQRLRALVNRGFRPSHLAAVERFRQRQQQSNGAAA